MKIDPIKICVDFDGTCVSHEFPRVGKDIGAVPVLKALVKEGHKLILFTMRANVENNTGHSDCVPEIFNGNFLDDAINWFKENDIPLFGIQVDPDQESWTKSPKAYGQLYIDDAALGCPLIHDKGISKKPFVNWNAIKGLLILKGILPKS